MEKAAFIDIFTTNNDLYGHHNCPIQFAVSLMDMDDMNSYRNGIETDKKKTKTIDIIPDEDIMPYGTYISGKRNNSPYLKEKYRENYGAEDLEPSLMRIYGLLSKIRENENIFLVGYNHINYDMKILNEHFKRILNKEPIVFDENRAIDVMECAENLLPVELVGNYSMDAIYTHYCTQPQCLDELKSKRSTESDIEITKYILHCMMNPEESFSSFRNRAYEQKEVTRFNFGKYKGAEISEIFKKDQQYLNWVLNNKEMQSRKKSLIESIKKMYNEGVEENENT